MTRMDTTHMVMMRMRTRMASRKPPMDMVLRRRTVMTITHMVTVTTSWSRMNLQM